MLLSGGMIACPAMSNPKKLRKRIKRNMSSTLDVSAPMEMEFANSHLNVHIATPGQYVIVIIGPKGDVRQEMIWASSFNQFSLNMSNEDGGAYKVLVAGPDEIRFLGSFYKEKPERFE